MHNVMEAEQQKPTVNDDLAAIYDHLTQDLEIPDKLVASYIAESLWNQERNKQGFSVDRIARVLRRNETALQLTTNVFNGAERLRDYLHSKEGPCTCNEHFYTAVIKSEGFKKRAGEKHLIPTFRSNNGSSPDLTDVRVYRPKREPLANFKGVERANVSNLFLKSKMFKKSLIRGGITGILAGLAGYGTGALITLSLLHIMPIGLGLLGVALGFGISIGIARGSDSAKRLTKPAS